MRSITFFIPVLNITAEGSTFAQHCPFDDVRITVFRADDSAKVVLLRNASIQDSDGYDLNGHSNSFPEFRTIREQIV